MKEPSKSPIAEYQPVTRSHAVPLEQWLDRPSVVPEFQHGRELLEWVVEQGAVFCDNISPLRATADLNLPGFLSKWAMGLTEPGCDLETDGWLKLNEYRVRLSATGNKLTVRRGNKYGSLIDLGGLAESNWPGIVESMKRCGIMRLPYPVTQGSVASSLLNYARVSNTQLPPEVLKLAWQCCKGGRMEGLTQGTVEGYAYDISSAYPAALRDLPRCDSESWGQWVESTEYQPNAAYGLAKIDVTLPDWPAGPLAVRVRHANPDNEELTLHFPVGRLQGVHVCQPDMQLLTELGISFKIHKGWWFFPTHVTTPFRKLTDMLWYMREADRNFSKKVSVALVGQLGSVVNVSNPWEDGDKWAARGHFAPVYFSHVYASVRASIFRKALEAGLEHTVAFCIDGVIVDRPLPIDYPGLGAWRLESAGQFFLAGDYHKDRAGDGGQWRSFVETTPGWVPDNYWQADFDNYVSLRAMRGRRELEPYLGDIMEQSVKLPLGPIHRQTPRNLTRRDYLQGSIPTWL